MTSPELSTLAAGGSGTVSRVKLETSTSNRICELLPSASLGAALSVTQQGQRRCFRQGTASEERAVF